MNYCFYVNDAYWIKVVGEEKFDKNVGHVCAHCTLERLGGLEWHLVWNEPASTCPPLAGESGTHAEPTSEADPCAAAGRHVCGPLDQPAAPPLSES